MICLNRPAVKAETFAYKLCRQWQDLLYRFTEAPPEDISQGMPVCLLLHISIHFKFEMFNKNTSLYFSDEPCLLYKKKCFSSQVKRTSGVFLSVLKGMFMRKKNQDSLIYSPQVFPNSCMTYFFSEVSGGPKEDILKNGSVFFCPYHGLMSNTVWTPVTFIIFIY